jgi:hypothetical protein
MLSIGNERMTRGTANLGTYVTGGIAITPAQCGLGVINSFIPKPAAGYVFQYSAGLVLAYVTGTSADTHLNEVATNTALSSITFSWDAIGR